MGLYVNVNGEWKQKQTNYPQAFSTESILQTQSTLNDAVINGVITDEEYKAGIENAIVALRNNLYGGVAPAVIFKWNEDDDFPEISLPIYTEEAEEVAQASDSDEEEITDEEMLRQIQTALEKAAYRKDAWTDRSEEILEKHPHIARAWQLGQMYCIVDREGNAAIVEYVNSLYCAHKDKDFSSDIDLVDYEGDEVSD